MTAHIRPFKQGDVDALVRLSLRAWAPNFASERHVLGDELDGALHGPDWRTYQQEAVEDVCASPAASIWVAEVKDEVVGFVAIELHRKQSTGEIHMLAVDPDHQAHGVGTFLTKFALQRVKDAGMAMAMVETGGDPGHASARRTYEKAGFTLLPIARYFKKL